MTCPYHFSLFSFIFLDACTTFVVPRMCSFLILSFLVTPHLSHLGSPVRLFIWLIHDALFVMLPLSAPQLSYLSCKHIYFHLATIFFLSCMSASGILHTITLSSSSHGSTTLASFRNSPGRLCYSCSASVTFLLCMFQPNEFQSDSTKVDVEDGGVALAAGWDADDGDVLRRTQRSLV